MFIVALVIMGFVGLGKMPWDLNPKVDFPIVSVTIPYPGASPDEIEQRVVRPLEDQVSVINGVDQVTSQAQENIGSITIRFRYGTDVDVAAADVRDALDRTKAEFPDEVKAPSIFKLDIGAMPVVTLGIVGNRPPRDLRQLVDDNIKPVLGQAHQRLGGEPDVADVVDVEQLVDERLQPGPRHVPDVAAGDDDVADTGGAAQVVEHGVHPVDRLEQQLQLVDLRGHHQRMPVHPQPVGAQVIAAEKENIRSLVSHEIPLESRMASHPVIA
jgi:Cu/Ag efflux pump CusA